MLVEDKTISGNDLISKVNKIIKDSFGKKFQGNYAYEKKIDEDGFYYLNGVKQVNRLDLIAKKRFFIGDLVVGFLNSDGSELTTFPKYKEIGIEYLKKYEEVFEKQSELIIQDKEAFKKEVICNHSYKDYEIKEMLICANSKISCYQLE